MCLRTDNTQKNCRHEHVQTGTRAAEDMRTRQAGRSERQQGSRD